MTYEQALARLLAERPFEGSRAERGAIEVYEHGLACEGPRLFWTLGEAIDDALVDYERDLHELALGMANDEQLQAGLRRYGANPLLDVVFSKGEWT